MFTKWNNETGTMKAGSIKRASSSNDKVWGEINKTEVDLPYGTFVAVNEEGGIKKIAAATDLVHGIVVLDIYGNAAPHSKQTNVGHFSHGDEVVAQLVDDADVKRGSKAYIVATGANAGKISDKAAGNIDLGYWVTEVSAGNKTAAITLGFTQATGA